MCKHYGTVLLENHRHYIDSLPHNNCVLCLAEDEGPMTQEKISSYFGCTKEWINQIEKAALRKLQSKMNIDLEDLLPEPLPSFTPKTVRFQSTSVVNFLDVRPQFSTEDAVHPYSWRHKSCIAK